MSGSACRWCRLRSSPFLAAGAVGVATDTLVLRPLRPAGLITTTIASVALTIALENLVRLGFGNELRNYDLPIVRDWRFSGIRVGPQQLEDLAISAVAVAALFLFLGFTRLGKAMRAVADNPTLAIHQGHRCRSTIARIVNFVAMGLAGFGGMLLGLDTSIDPLTGFRAILAIFAAAVVGGLGSIPGAVVGALTVGIAEELSQLSCRPTTARWSASSPSCWYSAFARAASSARGPTDAEQAMTTARPEIHSQGLHVRSVRHRGRHADRAGRGRHAVPRGKGWHGNPELVRHLVAAHAFRELDDRRAAAQRAHALSRDRRTLGRLRDGPCRHQLHAWTRCARWSTRSSGCGRFPRCRRRWTGCSTRYRLVVLSNGDPDMLEAAKQHHGIAFDRVISVAEANSFKPHVATYTKAAEIVGVRMDEVLFVANHAFDCIGAKAAGMRTAFIDRRQRPFGVTPHQPDLLVPSMSALADLIV